MNRSYAGIVGLSVLVASCGGKPDASGIYLAATDADAAMIQLVQSQDGHVTGRIEVMAANARGVIQTKNADLDGSVSGHDLMLRPASVWFGGIQASGTFAGSKLTLTRNGETVEAKRSSLEAYQAAVNHLKETARRRHLAFVALQNQRRIADVVTQVGNIAANLRSDTAKLTDGLSRSPNFAQLAAGNTNRIEKMVKRAPSLNDLQRNQLSVDANQVEVETNQIEITRSQYAIKLNDLVEDASQNMKALDQLCAVTQPSPMTSVCGEAKAAASSFKAVVEKGNSTFTPYKQNVQNELDKQNALSQRIH
jgi:hypothetical protein